ncbi:SOS response-associated peptidase [Mycobacterium sp. IDR2000157661]|uniref:SOS response-associated peptidase n=1 Tax=Mycobacterium sp. IDR2000157661 TaxID=2867005 RepID=UPI001EEC1590|nr:SOS response-associated peptidase [Mycobacterium sp. IDR2000157661]ULE33564.1 SOS response-associated peptidase [Mycobacterium sp. IDR2000157661]
MCGRFAVTTDPALLAEKIKAIDETMAATKGDDAGPGAGPNYTAGPNYNVAPTTTISAVVKRHTEPDDESTRRVRSMRWGLVPPWAKTTDEGGPETKGPLLINARSEKLTTSPVFRTSARNKRCLVPMDGWYEWQKKGDAKGPKTPYYMYAGDGEPLFMAGLWSTWRPREGSAAASSEPPLLSCTIITTDAAGQLAEIHDRMPLTISADDWDRWLDPDAPIDEGLLRGHGDLDRVEIREVSRLVNNVRNNGPELIEPVKPEPRQGTLL